MCGAQPPRPSSWEARGGGIALLIPVTDDPIVTPLMTLPLLAMAPPSFFFATATTCRGLWRTALVYQDV